MSTVYDELQAEAAPQVVTLQDRERTARKNYPCAGCRSGQIKVGDRYRYVAQLVDGELQQMRTCRGFFVHYGEACDPASSDRGVR